MAGWHHDNANWKPKQCAYCTSKFIPKSGVHKFCSDVCKRKHLREIGHYSTKSQYAAINGDWKRYFSRLCAQTHRKGIINRDDCVQILEKQDYKCALSGVPLTCVLDRGVKNPTNASLDRIHPAKGYSPSNVQLVCAVLNCFRNNTPVDDYINWCRKVVEYADQKAQFSPRI